MICLPIIKFKIRTKGIKMANTRENTKVYEHKN